MKLKGPKIGIAGMPIVSIIIIFSAERISFCLDTSSIKWTSLTFVTSRKVELGLVIKVSRTNVENTQICA